MTTDHPRLPRREPRIFTGLSIDGSETRITVAPVPAPDRARLPGPIAEGPHDDSARYGTYQLIQLDCVGAPKLTPETAVELTNAIHEAIGATLRGQCLPAVDALAMIKKLGDAQLELSKLCADVLDPPATHGPGWWETPR
ncbi:MAG: hypothetical protein ACR2GH_17070 [Pseudonocardia sp.]